MGSQNRGVGLEEDIWHFGVVLYEWATGTHPLEEHMGSTGDLFGNLWEMTQAKSGLTLPSVDSACRSDFSTELQELVAKCLRRKRSERPTADELSESPFVAGATMDECRNMWRT